MGNFCIKILGVILGLVMCTLISAVLAIPVLLLWNWLMPTIFGLTTITLGQAWGISTLCGILFRQDSSNEF